MNLLDCDLEASALRWFECGEAVMAIDSSTSSTLSELDIATGERSVVMDLLDAVLLDEQDPLLRCLDAWCHTSFDWQPMRTGPAKAGAAEAEDVHGQEVLRLHELTDYPHLNASLSAIEGTPRRIYLALEPQRLKQLQNLPEPWQSLVRPAVHSTECRVTLQQIHLNAEENDKLMPGSLVLLPDSYSPGWQVVLDDLPLVVPQATEAVLVGMLDTEEARIRLAPSPSPRAQDGPGPAGGAASVVTPELDATDRGQAVYSATIELLDTLQINRLYTWSVWQSNRDMVLPLPQALAGSGVAVTVRSQTPIAGPAAVTYTGELMRVGRGYGVLLEQSSA